MLGEIHPKAAPLLNLSEGPETCQLAIINTTCDLTVPAGTLVEPVLPGHELMNFPTLSFILKHNSSGKQVLFDLGCRKDFWNFPEHISSVIDSHVPGIRVEKDLVEILEEGKVDLENIHAAIISHHHYDHIGNPATFPKSVELVVGPGFTENFVPGFPTLQTSPFFEAAFEGRTINEISFSDELKVGGFQAHDYFNDGSLYILNVPGHAIGHISALVRTTPETFVFLGGDICHFGGAFRPTPYVPMPSEIPSETKLDSSYPNPCPCSLFTKCHPDQANARVSPYYTPYSAPDSWYVDPPTAQRSINSLKEFDASDNVLVIIAHDPSVMDILVFFPEGYLNDWQKNGWKRACRWAFLNELPMDGKAKPYLVDGTYKEGKRIKTLDGILVA